MLKNLQDKPLTVQDVLLYTALTVFCPAMLFFWLFLALKALHTPAYFYEWPDGSIRKERPPAP